MNGSYFLGNQSFEVRPLPDQQPGPGCVRVRVAACGVCGTDVHIYHGGKGSADVKPPVVLGHEFSGVVEALGPGVDTLALGDHVTVDPNMYCGKCHYCRIGKKQLCTGLQAYGVNLNGGFAETCVVKQEQCYRLFPSVPLKYGAMTEPLACAVHGIDRANIRHGDTVCVLGGGAVGLMMVQLARMAGAAMPAPLTGRTIRPRLSAGHAVYPQDMEGAELRLPMFEQARMLMERARLAARMTSQPGAPRVMPFARILQDGGTVLRALPQGRVRVGLGAQAKAREGMRFAVWGPSGQEGSGNQYKGEVVLLQVREFHSVAETVHLADATAPLEAGDRLSLLEVPSLAASHPHTPGGKAAAADGPATPGQEGAAAADAETESAPAGSVQELRARVPVLEDGSCAGIYGHGDFLHLFAQEKERTGRFVLAIVRVDVPHDARQEAALGECLAAWRQVPELCAGEPLAGLYGSNALIFFHADSHAEALLPHYAALCARLEEAGLPVSAGLAGYPLLHYRKGEMPDCALKALEYAQLLPSPRAGLCNSLALNISADRRYALGDVFGAIDEYKLALLADAENVLARNSLGVCMAALGRYHEARRHFLEALRYKGDAGPERQERIAQTHYNLGTVCQQLGERRAAARYYRECIKDAPEHVYAHLRLGQLCEEGGRRNEARRFYELAAAIEDRQAEQAGEQRPSLARRYLARLAARQRHGGEARELLHDTLLRNPFDAAAMLLLARLYLDGDEDPAMAELLARKSVGLRDTPEGWQVLARALRALGREEEASLAEAHASVG